MEIQPAPERIFQLEEVVAADELERRAMDRRMHAFGSGLGSLLQRPRPEDVVFLTRQRRLEPFWHVSCRALYVYERDRDYDIAASAPEVRRVSITGTTYEVHESRQPASFTLSAREHCRDEFEHQIFADGTSGAPVPDGVAVIGGRRSEVTEPASLAAADTVVVPVEHRASFVVRKLLGETMKPLQADLVIEESLTLQRTDLYYRPYWSFEFLWRSRDKTGVVEIDALTGQARQGQALLPQLKGMMSRDVLFDIGADTAGLIVPGGSIAVKVAKAAMDRNR